MALRAKWTIRINELVTHLRVGVDREESDPVPISVSVCITGLTPSQPNDLNDCFDYQDICDWVEHEWPKTPHTPLLEMRFNELVDYIFSCDKRIMQVWIGLFRQPLGSTAASVGLEREVTRRQHQEQQRQPVLRKTKR